MDDNKDSNVDADTSLADLDIDRLNSINVDGNGLDKIALIRKTEDNLARAEAMVDEKNNRE